MARPRVPATVRRTRPCAHDRFPRRVCGGPDQTHGREKSVESVSTIQARDSIGYAVGSTTQTQRHKVCVSLCLCAGNWRMHTQYVNDIPASPGSQYGIDRIFREKSSDTSARIAVWEFKRPAPTEHVMQPDLRAHALHSPALLRVIHSECRLQRRSKSFRIVRIY